MNRITKIAIQVECDGHPCAVLIDQEHASIAAQMLAAFCKDGILQLVKLPANTEFGNLKTILDRK